MILTRSKWRALKLLSNREGTTVWALMHRGCGGEELHQLVRDGLANAKRIKVRGKPPAPADFHLQITDAGRKVLARHDQPVGRGKSSKNAILMVLFVLGLLAGIVVAAFLLPPR
jgi:hypothetical protein